MLLLALLLCVSTAAAEIRLTQVEGGMDGSVMELVKGSFAMQIEGSEAGEIYRITLSGESTWAGSFLVQDGFVAGEPYLFRVQIADKKGEYGPLKLTVTGGGETVTREYTVRTGVDSGDSGLGGVVTNLSRQDEPALVLLEQGEVSTAAYGISWPGDGAVFSGQETGSVSLAYRVKSNMAHVELRLAGEEDNFAGSYGYTNKQGDIDTYDIPVHRMRYNVPYEFKVYTEDTNEVYTTTFTIRREAPAGEAVETEPVETLLTVQEPRLAQYNGSCIVPDDQFYDEVVAFMDAHLPRTVTGVHKGDWGDYYFGYDNDRDKAIHFGSIMVAYPNGAANSTYSGFTDKMVDEMLSLLTYTNRAQASKFKNKPMSTQGSNKKVQVDNRLTASCFEARKGDNILRVQPFCFSKNNKPLDGQLYIYLSLEGSLPSGFMSDCKDITWVCSKPEDVKALLDIMMNAATNLTFDKTVTAWYNSHADASKPAADAKAADGGQEKAADAASTVKVTGNCNIRSQPNGSGDKLGTAKAGETYPCLGVADNGWVNIVLEDGREGYISGAFGKLQD